MSKRIDFRFVCYSFACFAVVGIGVYFLHRWQAERQTGIFLAKAQQAETDGKQSKAIELYGKYLVLAPRDTDARSQYGSLLADAHAHSRAFQAFEAVLRLDPGRSDVRRKAVMAAMVIDRVSDARDHLETTCSRSRRTTQSFSNSRAGAWPGLASAWLPVIRCKQPFNATRLGSLRTPSWIAVLSRPREDLDKDREKWLSSLPGKSRLR